MRDAAVVTTAVVGTSVGGTLVAGLVGAGLLSAGVPATSALILVFLVAALVALLVTRRAVLLLGPASPRVPLLLLGPLLLGAALILPGTAPVAGKALVLGLVVGAGLLGLRTAGTSTRRAPSGDRGSGTLEFVGVVVLAGVLTAATIAAVVASSPAMSATIARVLCQITGGTCTADGGTALSDEDYVPEACDTYTQGKQVSSVVDIAFVRLGGTLGLERVEKSDGTIEVSLVDAGDGGLVASAGGRGSLTLGSNTYAANLEAEAALTLGVLSGETFTFTDRAQADAFQSYAQRELAEDAVGSVSPVIGGINSAVEWLTNEKPPKNAGVQRTLVRGDVTGTAEASAGFGYGGGGRGAVGFTTALGSEFDRGADVGDPADDTRTDFFQIDWTLAGQAGLPVIKGVDVQRESSGVIKVTRDASQQVSKVEIVDRTAGGFQAGVFAEQGWLVPVDSANPAGALDNAVLSFKGGPDSSIVVTRSIDLTTTAQRDAFDDWLTGGGATLTTVGQVVPGVDSLDGSGIAAGLRGAAFADRLRNEGRTSVVEYDGSSWGLGGALEGGLGLKLGADLGYSSNDASAVNAYYLGAPGEDGSRPAYPLPACVR